MEGKRIVKQLEKKDFTHPEAVRAMETWIVHHTDEGGWTEGEFDVHVWEDGNVVISGHRDGQFFSFSKEEWDIIKKFVESERNQQ